MSGAVTGNIRVMVLDVRGLGVGVGTGVPRSVFTDGGWFRGVEHGVCMSEEGGVCGGGR